MPNARFRHEIKHYLNMADYLSIRQRLRAVAKPDENTGSDGCYRIRSLYFDNVDNKALREKLDGVNDREKFRLRYYNDDLTFIKLEKKRRINGLGEKRAASVTREQCERLIAGDFKWLCETDDPLLLELYTKMQTQQLRPRTTVDYLREPFVYEPGNVRVTLDRQIRSGLSSRDFFNPKLPTVGAANVGLVILEVKYDEFLPELIRDIVQTDSRMPTAFSKYAACRMFL